MLSSQDKMVVMGTREGMRQLREQMSLATSDGTSQLVTIIGGGDVGSRLAQQLDQTEGIRLRVIERDQIRGEMLAATLRRGLVLSGDGTDLELLESEDVGRSDALVSVIDNDERNLLASLLGRQLGVSSASARRQAGHHARQQAVESSAVRASRRRRGAVRPRRRGDLGRAPDRRWTCEPAHGAGGRTGPRPGDHGARGLSRRGGQGSGGFRASRSSARC